MKYEIAYMDRDGVVLAEKGVFASDIHMALQDASALMKGDQELADTAWIQVMEQGAG